MKTKLFVLYGGKSVEHEISLKTALTVLQSIDRDKFDVYPVYITREGVWCHRGRLVERVTDPNDLTIPADPDLANPARSLGAVAAKLFGGGGRQVALPLLHGSNGEDGTVQGLLELLDIPYVGNGVLSSAVALDKAAAKAVLSHAGIAQAAYLAFRYADWQEEGEASIREIEASIGYPCYVKPASLGSSIGINRCEDRVQLLSAVEEAFSYDRKIVVEEEIAGREIQVAVRGNDRALASVPGEFIHDQAFFDYNEKYLAGRLAMSIPAELPEATANEIREQAIRAYQALDCAGLARVDFFLDRTGRLYLNEINTLPGFTAFSMYPIMWERTDGTRYSELIEKLIDYAFTRHADKQTIRYTRGDGQ
ncbi:D-alanine--D-alanine ligase [Cohnella nanjingensis]|uniref:D-alanine--D-alanine ligase n=1 Tax=Cohnella nanjingensis TaxID=1387779 RepID=A0A7X0RS52_9BACL|nr:D-alanine--D-alanine ligase [Cohnella nanjingensis]MBB6672689.1 D-alanine--D-alanine ligase [Cohnella nanjingensis]